MGVGILVYFRADLPYKLLKTNLPGNIGGLFIEMNISKWSLFAGYNPRKIYIHSFLDYVGKSLHTHQRLC